MTYPFCTKVHAGECDTGALRARIVPPAADFFRSQRDAMARAIGIDPDEFPGLTTDREASRVCARIAAERADLERVAAELRAVTAERDALLARISAASKSLRGES